MSKRRKRHSPERTARAVDYFARAQRMTFERIWAGQYGARGARGGIMYIGVCENPSHWRHARSPVDRRPQTYRNAR